MAATPDLLARRLSKADDRAPFRCGDPDLDRFLHCHAGRDQFRHHIGKTFVAIRDGAILGFVTVSPGEITADVIDAATRGHHPDDPLPILRLARLGVDERHHGHPSGAVRAPVRAEPPERPDRKRQLPPVRRRAWGRAAGGRMSARRCPVEVADKIVFV